MSSAKLTRRQLGNGWCYVKRTYWPGRTFDVYTTECSKLWEAVEKQRISRHDSKVAKDVVLPLEEDR
ncbi:unnamed protein product [Brugia pahangi]|uniref:Integrase_H2C2 domain-containing protein n=1 Tax=Brugia pahangi TaxID=6280 RepID=A0A0N4TZ47_BRUPA|nr:unnamed protein product [Brugia pahangi]